MNISDAFWMAAAAVNVVVLSLSVPQAWYRRVAIFMVLCAVALAAKGHAWPAVLAQSMSMLLAMTAWHYRGARIAAVTRSKNPRE